MRLMAPFLGPFFYLFVGFMRRRAEKTESNCESLLRKAQYVRTHCPAVTYGRGTKRGSGGVACSLAFNALSF